VSKIMKYAVGAALFAGMMAAVSADVVAQSRGASPPVTGTASQRFLDVIVALDPAFAPGGHAANRAQAARIARGLGLAPEFTYGTAIFGFAARIPEGRLTALEHDPRVLYVNLDKQVSLPVPRTAAPPWCTPDSSHPACQPDTGGGSSGQVVPWGISRIGADATSGTGAGIEVYVIDTGIDADHPDLQANLGIGYAVVACKGGCVTRWDDDHGHGTHVAGTIGAVDNSIGVVGVAPGVRLHAVKVLGKNGSGRDSGVIAGIDWVANQVDATGQPAVANMSLGGPGQRAGSCTQAGFVGEDAYHAALCNATHAGVVFVVAAGNDGADAELAVPAAYDDTVITASATMQGDDWPYWSNWGDGTSFEVDSPAPVAIAAPGVNILSLAPGGGTATKSGTSMASPHVAGTLALFLQSNSQAADFSAFTSARAALLNAAEPADTFQNTSGHRHDEDFVDAPATSMPGAS
jgi:subtilisin